MKVPNNWLAVMGLAMSLPSTFFGIAYGAFKLVELGYLTRLWAIVLFLFVVVNSLILLVWHGSRKKN